MPREPVHGQTIGDNISLVARGNPRAHSCTHSALAVKRLAIGGGQMSTRPYLLYSSVPLIYVSP